VALEGEVWRDAKNMADKSTKINIFII